MKIRSLKFVGLAVVGVALSGCVSDQGRLTPIEPIGRAIFNALNPAPTHYDNRYAGTSDPRYVDNRYQQQQRGQDNVWVEGAYGRDTYGGQVWIPAHWAR